MNTIKMTHPALVLSLAVAALVALACLLAVAVAGGPARAADSRRASSPGGPKPVIVLEHGAWADSSSWTGVIRALQRDGFTVYAPPDPLRGLDADLAYLHDFLT